MDDADVLAGLTAALGRAVELARRAPPARADRKAHQDYVTDVDLAVDAFLQDALPPLVPGAPVLSEERAAEAGAQGAWWCVDPIDGTANLMAGLPFVAVSVALVDRDGPRLAAVASLQGPVHSAIRGGGAWRDGARLRLPEAPLRP